jgi:hypothetical protein
MRQKAPNFAVPFAVSCRLASEALAIDRRRISRQARDGALKYAPGTRLLLVSGLVDAYGAQAGLAVALASARRHLNKRPRKAPTMAT